MSKVRSLRDGPSSKQDIQHNRSFRTDSSPSLLRVIHQSVFSNGSTLSSNPTDSSTYSSSSSSSCSSNDSINFNIPSSELSTSTVPPRMHWNREAPACYRPYDFRTFDIPHKALPAYLSHVGGLSATRQDPCHRPKADPFRRRSHIEEIFHKRVTDASAFSIAEQLPSERCPKQKPSDIDEVKLKAVESVVLADNVKSEDSDSSDVKSENGLSQLDWEDIRKKPERNDVLKECRRSFFRARKELFRLRQYDDYRRERNKMPEDVESWEISSDSTVETVADKSANKTVVIEVVEPIAECRPTQIVRVEDKAHVQEHEHTYLDRLRRHLWNQYEAKEREEQDVQSERCKSPEPLDEEEILKNLPKQDFLNERKYELRKQLADRLEELNQAVKLEPRNLPKTKVQFEKYNDGLMRARRELKDEAELVDEYYRKAGLAINVPEKNLPSRKKYRAVDHMSDHPEDVKEEASEPLVHTCMTRLEWSRWLGRFTKHEKLNLPKVKIPRLPKVVQPASEQSPIRMYIKGLHREDGRKRQELKMDKKSDGAKVKKSESKSTQWHLDELLYEKPEVSTDPYFVPYKAQFRPFSELAKDRYKRMQARKKRKRDFRLNHMNWINRVVDEICNKKYDG